MEARRLALLLAVGPDQPDRPDPLGDRRGDLGPLLRPRPGVAPEPPDEELKQHHHDRHERQREQREPERDLAQHHQGDRHDDHVLEQGDQRGGDDRLGLVHLGDDARHQRADAGTLEVTQIERQQVGEGLGAQVSHQPFLDPDGDLTRGIAEHVLEQQPGGQEHHQPAGRPAGRHSGHERLHRPVDDGLQLGRARPQLAGGTEQVPEQRHQQDEHDAVHEGGEEGGDQAERKEAPVGPHRPEKAKLGLHRQACRGVSRAIGRITSSGDTPPWRKAPR